ncbi:FAD-dependent monooxygenase [Lacinutrix sp.]|uniref:FAD-dependent oxidoreductase n=1 Tax=Lacinutrix sp. TaxID=1937692 RepID=UPI0030EDF232
MGGTALAVACLHRGISFTLYERDGNFNERSQGYGISLQQASKAIKGFGILNLEDSLVSTKHIVHTTDGTVIGEWGLRKWKPSENKKASKNTNIHIPRQSLRLALLKQLKNHDAIQWNHKLIDFTTIKNKEIKLSFDVNGEIKNAKADLIIGADGIRSVVRTKLIGKDTSPLSYLGCIVILGICPLETIKTLDKTLLDSKTVFQTTNGKERIYMMPYTENAIMWQLSFRSQKKRRKY